MRIAILGHGHFDPCMRVALDAALSHLGHNVVTIDNSCAYKLTNNRYDVNYNRDKAIKNHLSMASYVTDDYAEQTAPNGRSGKAHNLILAMNKKGKKW